ncbi:exported hypothetical protein [Frankia sp. AgKG'84/4]
MRLAGTPAAAVAALTVVGASESINAADLLEKRPIGMATSEGSINASIHQQSEKQKAGREASGHGRDCRRGCLRISHYRRRMSPAGLPAAVSAPLDLLRSLPQRPGGVWPAARRPGPAGLPRGRAPRVLQQLPAARRARRCRMNVAG